MTTPLHLGIGKVGVLHEDLDRERLECGVFKRVQIRTMPLGGTMIAWELYEGFKAKGPFHFFVDFARSGSNEWQPINTSPVVDDCFFTDVTQRHYDQLADFYYRVRLLLPNEGCAVHLSQPHQANGLWLKPDWLLAREIIRKEYLLQTKRTNMSAHGWIFKRRRWGQLCSRCLDWDTQEVKTECASCFGTKFEGGYFPAIDFRVTWDAPWNRSFLYHEQVSIQNNVKRIGRAVAYPYLDKNDVFMRRDSGERYHIDKINTVVEVGGIPIVVMVEMNLAPTTDLIYTIPLSGGSSSLVEDPPPPAPCGPQTGVAQTNDW